MTCSDSAIANIEAGACSFLNVLCALQCQCLCTMVPTGAASSAARYPLAVSTSHILLPPPLTERSAARPPSPAAFAGWALCMGASLSSSTLLA